MSSEAPNHEDVVLLDSTAAEAVNPGEERQLNDDASPALEIFGENLPDDEVRKSDPHLTRPLEPADLKPSLPGENTSHLAEQIAAVLRSRKLAQSGETPLLDQLMRDLVPSPQIRLHPGTTRKKIAGAGVTSEPLVFQSEASEALLEKWADRTLGTNIQTDTTGRPVPTHPVEPVMPPSKPRPTLLRMAAAGIAIIAVLAVIAFVGIMIYQHVVPTASIKLPW